VVENERTLCVFEGQWLEEKKQPILYFQRLSFLNETNMLL